MKTSPTHILAAVTASLAIAVCAEDITDNDFDDINPAIDETRIVWQASDGNDFEIATASITALIPIEGSLRITPRSLNLRSNGGSVSATLSLAGTDVNAADIDPASTLLQGSIPAENVRASGNSIRMKFNRAALQALLTAPANVEIELTATSSDGSTVTATDTIRTIP